MELADVGAHHLHLGSSQHEVVRARVRDVGEHEANHFSQLDRQPVIRLSIDQEDISKPAHQGEVRSFLAERHKLTAVQEQVVENQHLFAVDRVVVVRVGGLHQHVAVETELLLDVLPDMRVVPIDPGIRETHLVHERLAGEHRVLSHTGYPVEPVVQPDPVPVDGRRQIDVVGELDDDGRPLVDVDQRARVLTVEPVHDERLSIDDAAHQHCPHL